MNYKEFNQKLMKEGVGIIDINSTYIDESVTIEKGTIIYPNTSIRGNSIIGKDNIIDMNTIIINSKIGDNNKIISSYIEDSVIGDNNNIGPFAHLRQNTVLNNNITIGNFVELKNSEVKSNTKAKHLSYLGDAIVGERVNIGCGTITANMNGKIKIKNKTIICDDSYVGANTVLVAPVILNRNSFIAAGSVITKDVEEDSLAIARSRQINKINYNKKEGNV